jgi:TRAP-type C4-dicarboxylate transport system substrate-binding protein
MAAKYRQLFLDMMQEHRDLMLDFKDVHDKFAENEDAFKAEFNEKGAKVVEIIRDYERKLTSQQDKGQYSKFSSGLSDKFWDQIRSFLPRIDFVGVK